MRFKTLEDRDYRISMKRGVFKRRRVVPTQRVSVTNTETGEVIEGCDMDVTLAEWKDVTPFVKLFRPNVIEQMSFQTLRLFCYVMEKMNKYGIVELDPHSEELYEYTGYKQSRQIYYATDEMREMSVIIGRVEHRTLLWRVNEDCLEKKVDGRADRDKRPFVKIYEPRMLLGMSRPALSMFVYICLRMDYEGCVKMEHKEFSELTGYTRCRMLDGRGKLERGYTQFYMAKRDLVALDVIRPMTAIVDSGEENLSRVSKWYRVNPNVFIKGSRMEAGYGVE